ncbi:MAG: hypothetical protein JNM94_03925 [Phycisphaerae bacterium]|nr:hypothetical protein [Phycisphaerae bacterium]
MTRTLALVALVVAAGLLLSACAAETRSGGAEPSGRDDQRILTAGVPVKVSLPPEVPSGTEFPIVITFSGMSTGGGRYALFYQPESPLTIGVTYEWASTSPLVRTARAKPARPQDDDVTIAAATEKGIAHETTRVKKHVTAPSSSAGRVMAVSSADVGRGMQATVTVTMTDFHSKAGAIATLVSSDPRLDRRTLQQTASGASWSFTFDVPADAKPGDVVVVGVSVLSDRSDVQWATIRVK